MSSGSALPSTSSMWSQDGVSSSLGHICPRSHRVGKGRAHPQEFGQKPWGLISQGNSRDSVENTPAHTASIDRQREGAGAFIPSYWLQDSSCGALIPWNLWPGVARGQSKQPEVTGHRCWNLELVCTEGWDVRGHGQNTKGTGESWADSGHPRPHQLEKSGALKEQCFSTSTLPMKVPESSGPRFRWDPGESSLRQLSGKMLTYNFFIFKREWQYLFLGRVAKINDDNACKLLNTMPNTKQIFKQTVTRKNTGTSSLI